MALPPMYKSITYFFEILAPKLDILNETLYNSTLDPDSTDYLQKYAIKYSFKPLGNP